MKRKPVSSSNIKEIGYDEATQQMEIEFKQGKVYTFCGIPPNVYESLFNASSVGGYFNAHVRGKYDC